MDIPQPGTPPPFHYAGFWKRFLAYLIDRLILGAVALVLFVPFIAAGGLGAMRYEDYEDISPAFLLAVLMALAGFIATMVILQWLYFAVLESRKGATLGKMALGIMVVDMNGNRVSFGRATGRHFAKILSALILCIGFIIAGFTQQKQALHDILSGCLVINRQ